MLYSSVWGFSQDRVCRCGTMLLWYVHGIHLSAHGIVCVAMGLRQYCLMIVRHTMHLASLLYPIFLLIWLGICIAFCSSYDSVDERWLYHILYRNVSVVHNLKEMECMSPVSVQSVTQSFKMNGYLVSIINSPTCYKRQLWLALQVPMRTSTVAASTGAKGCIDCTWIVYMLCWMLCEVWTVLCIGVWVDCCAFHAPDSVDNSLRYLDFMT